MTFSTWVMNSERHDKFDFIPIVPERMVLASMSDPSTYLGGDTGLLMRPFRKETWIAILLMIFLLMATTKLFTFELKITKKTFDFSGKIRNIAYVTVSFFFLLILAYYEGALIMFFSTDNSIVFDDIKDVISMYPQRKLLMREGYDIYYLSHVESGDKDYTEFWNRVQTQPKDAVFSSLHDVFQRFPEGGVVIHELEGALEAYLGQCGGERKEHFDVYVRERTEYHNLIVNKKSPLGPVLRYGSRLLLERGAGPNFKTSWNRNHTDCDSLYHRQPSSMSIQFQHFVYLLSGLAIVMVLCLIIFFGEIAWKKLFENTEYDTLLKGTILPVFQRSHDCHRNSYPRYIGNPVFYSLQFADILQMKDNSRRTSIKSSPSRKLKSNRQYSEYLCLVVKTFRLEMFIVYVKPTFTVRSLKEKIEEQSGISLSQQRLLFSGAVLENEKRLCDYSVYNNSVIQCTKYLK